MTLVKGEGDIPSPGRLLLIDEESPGEPITHNSVYLDLSSAIQPVLVPCECNTRVRSPIILVPETPAQGVMGSHQVGSPPR